MKAIVQERFGSPDVLQFMDTDLPEIGPDDVLVRVHAAALRFSQRIRAGGSR
jgi:NADPH:quinone reductase-like Zn-dependent oxidoreductase